MVSLQGKNLVMLVVGGLAIGTFLSFFSVDGFPLVLLFLQVNSLVYHGWVWQLVTSIIVAPPGVQGLLDVGFNAFALFWLDGFTSAVYSPRQYYAVFLASGVFGNVISLLSGPGVTSFGASGGIFGLVAGLVSYDYAVNSKLSLALLSWFLFIFIYSSFVFADVDWLAHAGGAILGVVMGYAVGAREGASRYAL